MRGGYPARLDQQQVLERKCKPDGEAASGPRSIRVPLDPGSRGDLAPLAFLFLIKRHRSLNHRESGVPGTPEADLGIARISLAETQKLFSKFAAHSGHIPCDISV